MRRLMLKLSKHKAKMFLPAALIGVQLYFIKASYAGNLVAVIVILAGNLAMMIVIFFDVLFKIDATEKKLPEQLQRDYEIQCYDLGNISVAALGSSVGYTQFKFTNWEGVGVPHSAHDAFRQKTAVFEPFRTHQLSALAK